jgi:hypothetical protein
MTSSKLIVLDLCFRMAALMNQFDDAKNNGELHPSALVDGKSPFVLTIHYFKNYASQMDLPVPLGLCNLITYEGKAPSRASSSYKISSRISVLDLNICETISDTFSLRQIL